MANKIVIVGLIVKDRLNMADKVNDILHAYGDCIKGRLGLPGATPDVDVISVVMHTDDEVADSIEEKIGQLEGVTVKTVRADL